MTHKKWVSETKRLLEVAERSPEQAVDRLNHLVEVIEAKKHVDAGEWHVAQTLGMIGDVLSEAGRHGPASAAFSRLVKHHQMELVYHELALVSALSSQALALIATGQIAEAAKAVQRAERRAASFRSPHKLLDVARDAIAASRKRKSNTSRTR